MGKRIAIKTLILLGILVVFTTGYVSGFEFGRTFKQSCTEQTK